MPLPLALAPPLAVFVAIGFFLLIRWWIGRTGAALLLTFSLILNFILLSPLVLVAMLAQEVIDFQQKAPTAPKVLLVEKGPEILLAVSFTEVKDLERGFSSFKPLSKDQVARLTQLGDARYGALTRDYFKVFVVKREFLEKLAAPVKPATPGTQGQASQQDPAAIQKLLASATEAFMSNDLDRLARTAADLQKAFKERGLNDGADLARQLEQAARARDLNTLRTLAPKLAQFASPLGGGQGSLGAGAPPSLPISGDIILKVIDAEDPAKLLAQYLPQQAIQELSGGNTANLKLMLIAYLLQTRFQNGFDPMFLLLEYNRGSIQVYPATTISNLLKVVPLELPGQPASKPKQ